MSGYIGTQPVPQATQVRDVFTATSGQTTFATGGYTPNFVDVYLNGVKLVDGDDFTATNGSEVVLTTGATAGDTVEVLAYTAFSPANVYTIAEADAAFVKPNDNVTLGAVTATSFSGDGSGLTGLSAGATEVVSSGTASNVASIDFTGLDLTTYDYKIVFSGLLPATNATNLNLSGSRDNLSTLAYMSIGGVSKNVTSVTVGGFNTQFATTLDVLGFAISSGYPHYFELDMSFNNPSGVNGNITTISTLANFVASTGTPIGSVGFIDTLQYNQFDPLNSLRLSMSSGNISVKKYTLYRTVKS